VARIDLVGAEALPPSALAALAAMLDPDEEARAGRFAFAADRARFLVAHAALRSRLGQEIGCPPQEVRYRRGPQGKPALAEGGSDRARRLCFNLSHSRRVALIAWADRELGVDVEDADRDVDELELGRTVFSAREQEALAAIPVGQARRAAFYALWTRKEAILKALGTGLSREPRTIDLGLRAGDTGFAEWTDETTGERWTIAALEVGAAQSGAIAIHGALAEVRMVS
jgi:4'-phosphopantetheinyl transferase